MSDQEDNLSTAEILLTGRVVSVLAVMYFILVFVTYPLNCQLPRIYARGDDALHDYSTFDSPVYVFVVGVFLLNATLAVFAFFRASRVVSVLCLIAIPINFIMAVIGIRANGIPEPDYFIHVQTEIAYMNVVVLGSTIIAFWLSRVYTSDKSKSLP